MSDIHLSTMKINILFTNDTAAVPRNMGEETLGEGTLDVFQLGLHVLVPTFSTESSAFPPVAILPWRAIRLTLYRSYPTIDSLVQQQQTLSLSAGTHSQQHIIMLWYLSVNLKLKKTSLLKSQ